MNTYLVSLSQLPAFGQALASVIKPGDVVGLNGGLGAGKTTLIKTLCQHWGMDANEITSPTYVYHHQYECNYFVDHMDFYRLEDPMSIDQLGLRECLETQSIVLIEWMNKFPNFTTTYMQIDIDILSENERAFKLMWIDFETQRIDSFTKALSPWRVPA